MSLLNNALGTVSNSQFNPLQLFSELKSGKVSTDTVLNILRKNSPQQVAQIEQLMRGKNNNQINNLINNLCQQKGINVNELMQLMKK